MNLKMFIKVAVFAALAGAASNAHAQWLPNYLVYSIQRIGLFGPQQTGSAGLQTSSLFAFPAPGSVAGSSTRYIGASTTNGINTWVYNPTTNTTVQTGLTGPGYTGSAGYQNSVNVSQNAAGQVFGYSNRITNASTTNGINTWVYNPTTNTTVQTGLTGTAHTGSAGYQYGDTYRQTATGLVIGYSQRITGVSTDNGKSTWVYNPTTNTTVQTGLTGSTYSGSAGYQVSDYPLIQNNSGQIAGYSQRITGVNTYNGYNTWVYNPSTNTTVQTGFTSTAHTGSAGRQYSSIDFQNNAGQVVGFSQRFVGVSTDRGQNTWWYDPASNATVQTGLNGPAYTDSQGRQYSVNASLSAAGHVAGISRFYITGVISAGRSAWVYNPATNTTVRTGLTDTAHTNTDGLQTSEVTHLNDVGQVAGYSVRYGSNGLSNGESTWVYNASTNTTERTGLTGPSHTASNGYQSSVNNFQSASGYIAGASGRLIGVNYNGENTWVYNPSTNTTVQIGFTGAAHTGTAGYQFSENYRQSASGQVEGASKRYTDVGGENGGNLWIYSTTTNTTVQTGLTGPAHTGSAGSQSSFFELRNTAGHSAGTSFRIIGVSTTNGRNTWAYSPTTNSTVQTGLTGAAYTGSAGFQDSRNRFQNAAGQIAGYSQRIIGTSGTNGQDVWYFDPMTNLTSAVIGSVRTTDNYAYSVPTILTDSGFLLGYYTFFAGGVGPGETRAFIFRPDLGFTDLSNLVSGGLAASGWSSLFIPAYADALDTIVGSGLLVNGQSTSEYLFVMTAPAQIAPGAFSLLLPADGESGTTTTPLLTWDASSNATNYTLIIATNAALTSPLLTQEIVGTSFSVPAGVLSDCTTYYWGVVANGMGGNTNSTPASRSFSTRSAADFNGDGFLDFTDFDAFVAGFEAGEPAADFNADGFIDFTDFDAFVIGFEAGC